MGEVVPACTSPTLHPPSPPTVHQFSQLTLKVLVATIDALNFFDALLLVTLCGNEK